MTAETIIKIASVVPPSQGRIIKHEPQSITRHPELVSGSNQIDAEINSAGLQALQQVFEDLDFSVLAKHWVCTPSIQTAFKVQERSTFLKLTQKSAFTLQVDTRLQYS
ncbi:hypothetical protein ACFLR1_02595 [Bacteroidota bacterium]